LRAEGEEAVGGEREEPEWVAIRDIHGVGGLEQGGELGEVALQGFGLFQVPQAVVDGGLRGEGAEKVEGLGRKEVEAVEDRAEPRWVEVGGAGGGVEGEGHAMLVGEVEGDVEESLVFASGFGGAVETG